MLRDDLDRIRIEVEAKQRLLARKTKDLNQVEAQLELCEQEIDTIPLGKKRQDLLDDIALLQQVINSAAEEYAIGRNRLERVTAIKGTGSLPPPLNLGGGFALSSTPSLPEALPADSPIPATSNREVVSRLTKRGANNPRPPLDQADDERRRVAITRKLNNPDAYSVLFTAEAAKHFEVTPRQVHRWIHEGKLKRGPRRGTVTIESVLLWRKKRARKRRSG